MKFPLLLLLSAAAFSFAQWGNWGGGGGKTINDYKKESVSGRDIHVYAPSNLKAKSPLLISCHGMDQDPSYQQENTHWEEVADTAGSFNYEFCCNINMRVPRVYIKDGKVVEISDYLTKL